MDKKKKAVIAAIILAAGQSRRMGQPKMILPWGKTTVIGQVVETLNAAELDPILVVTGGARQQVEDVLQGLPAQPVFNPDYENDHMASSLKIGLNKLPFEAEAALVALGDQPQIELQVVEVLLRIYREHRPLLLVPSYKMRRGHPWIVAHPLWQQIIDLRPEETLRDFILACADKITYAPIKSDSILRDLDTPEIYLRERRRVGQ